MSPAGETGAEGPDPGALATEADPATDVIGPTLSTGDAAALYADFAECDPLPEQAPYEEPDGMVPLGDAWVEQVSVTDPLVTVTGLVDATPIELRDAFAGDPEVELVYVEDEGYEVEILLDVGGRRTFLKATIRCRTGSVFAQIIGPAGDADLLPVPGQQAQSGGGGS